MLTGSVVTRKQIRTTRQTIARVGICAAITLAVGSLQACGNSTHAANATASTATGPRVTPFDVAGFPSDLQLEPERVFIAFVDMQYGERSVSRWYMGFGTNNRGQTVKLEVDALAPTADQANRYCAAIAGAAAFFMKGVQYTLVIAGERSVASAASPGVVLFKPATYKPVSCPRPDGPLVDPARANEPRTSDDAISRFVQFLDKYYGAFGVAGSGSWYAGYAYPGTGTKIAVNVHDRTGALAIKRCDTVRPLADWLLGPFAKQFTVQVRGVSGTGSTSWPAVNCP